MLAGCARDVRAGKGGNRSIADDADEADAWGLRASPCRRGFGVALGLAEFIRVISCLTP